MEKDALLKSLYKKAKGESQKIICRIIEEFGENKHYLIAEHKKIAEYMDEIKKSGKPKSQLGIELTEQDVVTSEFLLEKINPWVRSFREKMFGSPDPPFNWEDAVKWIEKEAKENSGISRNGLIEEVEKLTKKYDIGISIKECILPYIKKGNEWTQRVIAGNSKLRFLEQETRKMAKMTGFDQASLVIHVLTGIGILMPRVIIYRTLPRKEITLEIKARDFTFNELRDIYKKIRMEVGLKKVKSLKKNHLLIFKFVNELKKKCSDQEDINHAEFWKEVKEKWDKKYPDYEYDSWRGLKIAYKRIREKLENLY